MCATNICCCTPFFPKHMQHMVAIPCGVLLPSFACWCQTCFAHGLHMVRTWSAQGFTFLACQIGIYSHMVRTWSLSWVDGGHSPSPDVVSLYGLSCGTCNVILKSLERPGSFGNRFCRDVNSHKTKHTTVSYCNISNDNDNLYTSVAVLAQGALTANLVTGTRL